jgi:hypothetical protein
MRLLISPAEYGYEARIIAARPFALSIGLGGGGHGFAFRCSALTNFTPSRLAFCLVALSVRLSLRVTPLVFVFSRTSVFKRRTSSVVHGFFVVFAITIALALLGWPPQRLGRRFSGESLRG